MKDFTQLFDQWSLTYDDTVYGNNNEYSEVFENYDRILEKIQEIISDKKDGLVLEIGVGTGNLTQLLYDNGFKVIGIEPSRGMREICQVKLPFVEVMEGSFLSIPISEQFDAIITSYAFHHLDLEEKRQAVRYLDSFLKEGGRLVIADTMFESPDYKRELFNYVESAKAFNLLKDLNTEYYDFINDLSKIFVELNYSLSLAKMNKYAWILSAVKNESNQKGTAVESFTMDHTKVAAPFIRKCSKTYTPKGDLITKFDLRFTQPNAEIMPTGAVHAIEHLLAGYIREEIDGLIDLSPMGCRTGFYLLKLGDAEEKEIALALTNSLNKILNTAAIPAANPIQCGNYRDLSLGEAKLFSARVVAGLRQRYQLQGGHYEI